MSELDRMIWIDMETTGLNPAFCVPLEIGFKITDLELEEIDTFSTIIFDKSWEAQGLYSQEKVDPFVWDMHVKSGLWKELPSGAPVSRVENLLDEWLALNGVQGAIEPLCGSSVGFDHEWFNYFFQTAARRFSYRNIDVSTLKELMKRFSPAIYAEQSNADYYLNRKLHRVMPDIEDTISEFKFYRKEFLYVPSDFA